MTKYKALLLFNLTAISIFGTAAQSNCDSKQNKKAATNINSNQNTMSSNKKPAETPTAADNGEIKTLAEGFYGKVEKPFLFVARSAETYRQLRGVIEDLPPDSGVDYNKQAIVAAFAGTRNTGGYSVEIKKSGKKVSVSVNNPPPGAMVTEALTMPYKVAIVPVEAENGLNLEVSNNWKNAARIFKLSSGEFESSGGIAGRLKKFAVEGTIDVWQFGDFITFDFNLSGKDANKNMQLTEIASGALSGGKINLARLDTGSFSEGPKPPLKVSGTISNGKLILTFEPLPTNAADGFQARGNLEAMLVK
jgi:PrcB C-terminal